MQWNDDARVRSVIIIRPMASRTGIEWTNVTWNPVTGCTQVSAGCDNCNALTLSRGRSLSVVRTPDRTGHR